jgi:hypothetical protein
LEGGRVDADGEKGCLRSSRSDISSDAIEERGEPGDSVIGIGVEADAGDGEVED